MYQHTDFIIPECYVDTNLIENLICHGGCNHQKGCNQVAKVMQEKFGDRFAVGIIDADKRRPGYLSCFSQVGSSTHISLFRHSGRPHYIILIKPAIDGFILSCAQTAGIDLRNYDLSPDLKEFTTQTKNVMSNKDQRFRRLFRDMQDSEEIKLLSDLLSYLSTHQYQSSEEDLQQIFSQIRSRPQR